MCNGIKDKRIPLYLYDNTVVPTIGDGKLYHFTKASSLIKILETMSLKVSRFDGLNDPTDGILKWTEYEFEEIFNQIECEDYIKNSCSLICFSRNYKRSGIVQRGTYHHRMWAQYGENQHGACIVIDKNRFLEENKTLFNMEGAFADIGNVTYSDYISEIKYDGSPHKDFIIKHRKEIFYKKNRDWQDETEARFLGIGLKSDKLSIQNSISYICLGSRFLDKHPDSVDYGKLLIDTLINYNNKCYKRLIPSSFAIMQCSMGQLYEKEGDNDIEQLVGAEYNHHKEVDKYHSWYKNTDGYECVF